MKTQDRQLFDRYPHMSHAALALIAESLELLAAHRNLVQPDDVSRILECVLTHDAFAVLRGVHGVDDRCKEYHGGAILLNYKDTPLGDFLTPADYQQFVSGKYRTGAAGDTVRLDGAAFALTPFAVTHETDHQTEHLLLVHPVSALARNT